MLKCCHHWYDNIVIWATTQHWWRLTEGRFLLDRLVCPVCKYVLVKLFFCNLKESSYYKLLKYLMSCRAFFRMQSYLQEYGGGFINPQCVPACLWLCDCVWFDGQQVRWRRKRLRRNFRYWADCCPSTFMDDRLNPDRYGAKPSERCVTAAEKCRILEMSLGQDQEDVQRLCIITYKTNICAAENGKAKP